MPKGTEGVGPAPSEERRSARVKIENLSPEGAGIIAHHSVEVARREVLMLHFSVRGTVLDIPAKVAWRSDEGEFLRLGLELRLELASAVHRQRYAEWIVSLLRK